MFNNLLHRKRNVLVLIVTALSIGVMIPASANLSNSLKSNQKEAYSLKNQSRTSQKSLKHNRVKKKRNSSKARRKNARFYDVFAGPLRVSESFGVNYSFPDPNPKPGELEMLASTGIRWVRMDMSWGYVERNKGTYDFAAYDKIFSNFEKYNLRPMVVLASNGQKHYPTKSSTYPYPPDTPEARQAFTNWTVATVQRYKGRGIIWEIYNEPNNSVFWPPNADVQDYSQLALMVGKAIKQAAPNEKCIGPALLFPDANFLEETLKKGLLSYWDAISLHPYRHWGSPESVTPDYAKFQDIIQKYNSSGSNFPLIAGEWGYASVDWNGQPFNEDKQARYLARQWLVNLSNNIPVSIWYQWQGGSSNSSAWDSFGLVRNKYYPGRTPVYDPRKSYIAAKTLTTTLQDYAFLKRIKSGSTADYILEFANVTQSSGTKAYAIWKDSATPTRLNLPITSGTFKVVSHLGRNLGTVQAGVQGLSMELSSSPKYLLPQ